MVRSFVFNTDVALWPLGAIAPLFGGAYFLLCYCFPESIAVLSEFQSYLLLSHWGGIEVLFLMVSVGMGWAYVSIAEHRLHWSGASLLLVVLPFCLGTVAVSFLGVWVVVAGMPDAVWGMMTFSAIVATVTGVIRIYWGSLE